MLLKRATHSVDLLIFVPPALRFNEAVVRAEISRFGHALGASDPASLCEEFARHSGYRQLRDLGVPEDGLHAVAQLTATRPGALANPRAGLAAADLRALPLHLVKSERPVPRRCCVYIIDGSDDSSRLDSE